MELCPWRLLLMEQQDKRLHPNQFLARVSSGGLLLTGIVVIFANGFAGSVAEWINPVSALLICSCILFLNSCISYRQKQLNRSVASFSVDTK